MFKKLKDTFAALLGNNMGNHHLVEVKTKNKVVKPTVRFDEFFYTARKFGDNLPLDENGMINIKKALDVVLSENGITTELHLSDSDEIIDTLIKNPNAEIKVSLRDAQFLFAKYGNRFVVGDDCKFYLLDGEYADNNAEEKKQYKLVRVTDNMPDVLESFVDINEEIKNEKRSLTQKEKDELDKFLNEHKDDPSMSINIFFSKETEDWEFSNTKQLCKIKKLDDGLFKEVTPYGYMLYKNGYPCEAKYWKEVWKEYTDSDEYKQLNSKDMKRQAKNNREAELISELTFDEATERKKPEQASLFLPADVIEYQIIKNSFSTYKKFIQPFFDERKFDFILAPFLLLNDETPNAAFQKLVASKTNNVVYDIDSFVMAFKKIVTDETVSKFITFFADKKNIDVLVEDYKRIIEILGGPESVIHGYNTSEQNIYTPALISKDGHNQKIASIRIGIENILLLRGLSSNEKKIIANTVEKFEKTVGDIEIIAYGQKQIDKCEQP